MGPAEFGVSPTTGFMPEQDPLPRLSDAFDAWEDAAISLPKLLVSDWVREIIRELPAFPLEELTSEPSLERAMVLLSYLGHAYVWSGPDPANRLPANLAVPWHAVASRLRRPPVLSYASYCLHNWRRIRAARPVELGNIALIQNFLAGEDEEWFVIVHADIEMRAALAVSRLIELQGAVSERNEQRVCALLEDVASSIGRMNETMSRMTERCEPFIYFRRVRPYIHGWRDHPGLRGGVVYEGVAEYGGEPQTFRGETGAQSAIVPSLDAVLAVSHGHDELRSYLMEMRRYMPPNHRAFVEHLEAGPNVREFVKEAGSNARGLYNDCVHGVEKFRSTHLQFAAKYIYEQASSDPKNPTDVGTGGTPFMPYLRKHRDETRQHRL
jgi:indoleamine 2,3-dioxygenase